MEPQDFNKKNLFWTVKGHVTRLPIYREEHLIEAELLDWDTGEFRIGYEAIPGVDPRMGMGFHLRVQGKVCNLESIGVTPQHRGKGIGSTMYEVVEDIARDLGCESVRQTPEGVTGGPRTESRRDYLLRRGYEDVVAEHPLSEVEKRLG